MYRRSEYNMAEIVGVILMAFLNKTPLKANFFIARLQTGGE